jgi:hypothetical protein
MEFFDNVFNLLNYGLDGKRKRHIVGGFFISCSLMFGGLAITIMTVDHGGKSKNE